MSKSSPQTKSFVILLVIAVVGTYLSVSIYNSERDDTVSEKEVVAGHTVIEYKENNPIIKIAEATELAEASDWPLYTNEDLSLSFKYNPDWKVLEPEEFEQYTLIEIDPGRRFYNIKIYVSDIGYASMKGLPLEPIQVDGVVAKNVNNLLYALEKNNVYYTFDLGMSLSLTKDFNTLVSTVGFLE